MVMTYFSNKAKNPLRDMIAASWERKGMHYTEGIYKGAKNGTKHSRHGLTNAEYNSLELLAPLFLIQLRIPLVCFSAESYFWLISTFVCTRMPQVLFCKVAFQQPDLSISWCMRLLLPAAGLCTSLC